MREGAVRPFSKRLRIEESGQLCNPVLDALFTVHEHAPAAFPDVWEDRTPSPQGQFQTCDSPGAPASGGLVPGP